MGCGVLSTSRRQAEGVAMTAAGCWLVGLQTEKGTRRWRGRQRERESARSQLAAQRLADCQTEGRQSWLTSAGQSGPKSWSRSQSPIRERLARSVGSDRWKQMDRWKPDCDTHW